MRGFTRWFYTAGTPCGHCRAAWNPGRHAANDQREVGGGALRPVATPPSNAYRANSRYCQYHNAHGRLSPRPPYLALPLVVAEISADLGLSRSGCRSSRVDEADCPSRKRRNALREIGNAKKSPEHRTRCIPVALFAPMSVPEDADDGMTLSPDSWPGLERLHQGEKDLPASTWHGLGLPMVASLVWEREKSILQSRRGAGGHGELILRWPGVRRKAGEGERP